MSTVDSAVPPFCQHNWTSGVVITLRVDNEGFQGYVDDRMSSFEVGHMWYICLAYLTE